MGDLLSRFVEDPRRCDYLGDREASLEYRVMTDVEPEKLEQMLLRGWRRLGPFYFRPACAGCFECLSLRIPVATFTPTESQKRALRRARRFRLEIGRPRLDRRRLDLYERWHAEREERRGWPSSPLKAEDYALQFAYPHPAVREMTTWDGDRLLSVGLCDVTPRAWSAIYFFYDPELGRLSPGVANVMHCLELARASRIPHVYLGYRVMDCASMRYKSLFHPHELLVGRPGPDEEPRWVPGGVTALTGPPPAIVKTT